MFYYIYIDYRGHNWKGIVIFDVYEVNILKTFFKAKNVCFNNCWKIKADYIIFGLKNTFCFPFYSTLSKLTFVLCKNMVFHWYTNRQNVRHSNRQREGDVQTGLRTDVRTNRQTDRLTDRERNKQIGRERECWCIFIPIQTYTRLSAGLYAYSF